MKKKTVDEILKERLSEVHRLGINKMPLSLAHLDFTKQSLTQLIVDELEGLKLKLETDKSSAYDFAIAVAQEVVKKLMGGG